MSVLDSLKSFFGLSQNKPINSFQSAGIPDSTTLAGSDDEIQPLAIQVAPSNQTEISGLQRGYANPFDLEQQAGVPRFDVVNKEEVINTGLETPVVPAEATPRVVYSRTQSQPSPADLVYDGQPKGIRLPGH